MERIPTTRESAVQKESPTIPNITSGMAQQRPKPEERTKSADPTDGKSPERPRPEEARASEADGPVRSVESAERIIRLLRSKRSFSELKDQGGEYVTPSDDLLCEQESSQARQMDRGEIEVEEERRVRAKRVPVLPADKEKDENEIVHTTMHSQSETEDSHRCSPKESLVLRVTMGRGFLAHDVHMGPCVDTEDPQCGGNLSSASRKSRDSCGQWCPGKP